MAGLNAGREAKFRRGSASAFKVMVPGWISIGFLLLFAAGAV